jgi:hypothetical protein
MFWDITPCSLLKVNRCFSGICCLHLHGKRIRNQHKICIRQSSQAFFLLGLLLYPEMATVCSFETSVYFQRIIWHCIPENRSLHNHRCENIRSYVKKKYLQKGGRLAPGGSSAWARTGFITRDVFRYFGTDCN